MLPFIIGFIPIVAFLTSSTVLGHLNYGNLVVSLTTKNFKDIVERSAKPTLVKFYSPGCRYCVEMVNVWKEVARYFDGHLTVATVNCQEDSLCNKYHVKGYPTIKLFIKGPKGEAVPIDFRDGNRTKDAFVSFAKQHVASAVYKVSDSKKTGVESSDAFLAKDPKLPHVLLFKSGTLTPSMSYKTLSIDFKKSYVFGIVNSAIDGGIAKKFGVELPSDRDAMVFIQPGETKGELYPGKNSFIEITAYLKKQLGRSKDKQEL